MSKWISVGDRLPLGLLGDSDIYKDVLVLVTDGVTVVSQGFAAGSDWAEWLEFGEIRQEAITHWMPLPKPPTQ